MIRNLEALIIALTFVGIPTDPLHAQIIVPSDRGSCPSGSNYAGAGYCRSNSTAGFIRADRGSCPSGTTYAGAGYCRTDGTWYVPADRGSCPSGAAYAGAGYCRAR